MCLRGQGQSVKWKIHMLKWAHPGLSINHRTNKYKQIQNVTEQIYIFTLTAQNLTKSHLHKRLSDRPNLPLPRERLTCRSNDHGVQLLTLG